ncbi:unnamed protein product, partial [Lampetra fluviatilis]
RFHEKPWISLAKWLQANRAAAELTRKTDDLFPSPSPPLRLGAEWPCLRAHLRKCQSGRDLAERADHGTKVKKRRA